MKFSVVIPVYNGEAHLANAVRCLDAQTFRDWECVIVDDGSKDGTPALADRLAAADPRVRAVHQPNGGVSVARNAGLDAARGDWIVWLDADDGYVPDALERIARLTEEHSDCSCLQFPYFECPADCPDAAALPSAELRPVVPRAYAEGGGKAYAGREAFEMLYARRGTRGQHWQPWRYVFRREARPRFRAGVIHEDVDVLPLHLARLGRVYIASEPLYLYVPARTGAATASFTPKRVRDILDVTAHVYAEAARAREEGVIDAAAEKGFHAALAYNLVGFYRAVPSFPPADREELFSAFERHADWLLAIDDPPRTAPVKRLLLRLLGVRLTARL